MDLRKTSAVQTDVLRRQHTTFFHEPSGLALADGKLFIADTNNHAIRVCDMKIGDVSTLKVK